MLELVAEPVPRATTYTVRCGPFAIDVAPEFDEQVLAKLLAVVAGC